MMNKKILSIHIKVTPHEHELLHEKAKQTGNTLSSYLRNMGLNYPINSVMDKIAFNELLKVKGDFGRVGGLFKLWLSNNKHEQDKLLGKYQYKDISSIIDEITDRQNEILKIARRLL